MHHVITLDEVANQAHAAGLVESTSQFMNRFIVDWLKGDEVVFPKVDTTVERETDLRLAASAPGMEDAFGRGNPEAMAYGLNRFSLAERLVTSESVAISWNEWTEHKARTRDPNLETRAYLRPILAKLIETIEEEGLTEAGVTMVKRITISVGSAIRYFLAKGQRVPAPLLGEIRDLVIVSRTAGRQQGQAILKDRCCACLDELIEGKVYRLQPRGSTVAARLISEIYQLPLTENAVASNIRAYHDERLSKQNKT